MGLFASCCKPSAADVPTPDAETRRRQQAEAAEKRAAQQAARGLRDAERIKRNRERDEAMRKREEELIKSGGANLKWTAN